MPLSHSKPKSLSLRLLGIACLIGLGVAPDGMLNNSAAAEDNLYPVSFTSQTQNNTPIAPEGLCVQGRRDIAKLPPEKQAMAKAEYQGCIEARQSPLPPPNSKPRPQTTPAVSTAATEGIARRAAGAGTIIEHGLAPLPSMAYVILNSWYREIDGKRTTVYAGASRDDPGGAPGASQGIIVVMVDTLDFKPLPEEGGEYPTPAKMGPVRIVDANGMQLTLVTQSGEAFFFNVASRQFVFPGPKTPIKRGAGAGKITESRTTALGLADDDFVNQWSEEINGQRITVLAGSEHGNTHQGILVVSITSLSTSDTILNSKRYITPLPFGAVYIVEANGEQLTLATREGGRFVFDVASRQFTSWPEMPPAIP